MCGLVGAAGNCTNNIKDTFTELLLVDVVRGAHSTGTAIVERASDKISVAKAPMPSPYFIGTNEYKDLMKTLGLKVMIGHNRFATVGDKTAENAHPFEFDNLVGAHNGTLENWALKNLEDWDKFGTDSQALYHSMSTKGVKDTIGQLSGAWALSWFGRADNSMNLLRNNKRPLYYAYSLDRETLFWASEANMLEWVVKRNNIKLFENGVFECDADKHYRWTIPEKISDKFEKPVVAAAEGRSFQTFLQGKWHKADEEDLYAPYSDYTGYHGSVGTTSRFNYGGHKHHKHTVPAPPTKIDTKKFRPPYKDAYGRIINKKEFEKTTSTGCVFCDNTNSVWGEFIFPLKDDMDGRKLYLCEGCYNEDDIRELIKNSM